MANTRWQDAYVLGVADREKMPIGHYQEIAMTHPFRIAVLMMTLLLAASTVALAAKPKKYQVTGIVVALTSDLITVEKGKGADAEKFEIARTADTKVDGDLKIGAKVTVEYTMTAANVEVKEAPPGK